ncbi:uncharacterized protein TNCV_1417941 [Trichonephila clavipes]|nr:uncharacterized protein TNCV_1417941 [Trichonephila clavipes]
MTQTPDHLKDNIRRVIADIRPQMLEKVIENWTSRLDYIRASRGSSIPGEDTDVCKCIVPSRYGKTLNSRRATSPLVRLVEGEERWKAPNHTQGVLPQNWGETELIRSVTCMMLKATNNARRHLALCHDEFRWP